MISFELDEDQQIIQETVRKFAAEHLRPSLRAWEKARAVPADARRAFHELGLGLIDLPESLGGGGATALTAALVHEELAFGDPAASVALWAPHAAASAIVELGDEAQAKRLLARFADAGAAERLGAVAYSERGKVPLAGFATTAEKRGDGWVLNGQKCFVINGGRADLTVVFAQVEPGKGWDGVGAFVVEAGAAGIKEGARHDLLALDAVHTAEVKLEGCVAKERLARIENAPRFFARMVLTTAARQVGLARAAYEYALAYTQERQAFGKPVAHFQAIAFTLAEMHMDVEAARWMVWRAAAMMANEKPPLREVAMAGAHANEAAWRVADNAVQLLGGAGFVQDYPVEKWLRDTKALALTAPTDQLSQLAVASAELGHPVDVAWPTNAIQPIFT